MFAAPSRRGAGAVRGVAAAPAAIAGGHARGGVTGAAAARASPHAIAPSQGARSACSSPHAGKRPDTPSRGMVSKRAWLTPLRFASCVLASSALPRGLAVAAASAAGQGLAQVSLLHTGMAAAVDGAAPVPPKMRAVVARAGRAVVDEEYPTPVPKDSEVLVAVKYTAINRADTLQREGRYPPPPGVTPVLGLELVGTVAAHGPACTLTGTRIHIHVLEHDALLVCLRAHFPVFTCLLTLDA